MYQFTDAIDKVKFDEEFSDVADNIKNDCKQLECMSFSDAVIKINEWIDKVFSPCKCSIIDYPEWFKIVVWRIIYNELKTNPQARQTELIEDNINLPKDVFGKKYWNMYSPDMKLQQEEYDNLFLPFNYAQVECNHIYRAMIHHIICSAVVPTDTIVDVFGKLGLVPALCANGYKNKERWKQKGFDADITDILEDYRAETNKKIKREKVNVLSTFLISLYDYDHDSLQLDITKLIVLSPSKTKSSIRIIYLPQFVVDEMKDYCGMLYGRGAKDRLFVVTKSHLEKEIKRGAELAGLTPIRVHDLRHSHASLLISQGVNVAVISRRLGHKSIKTTLNIYAHMFDKDAKEAADMLDKLYNGEED